MINSIYIPKIIKTQTTGNVDSVAQAFSQNRHVRISPQSTSVFAFENPVFNIEGASRNYYEQNLQAISYNLNNGKEYTIHFTGNTFSLSGLTTLHHELYRVTYEDFTAAQLDNTSTAFTQSIASSVSEPIVTFIDSTSGSTGVFNNLLSSRYSFVFPTQIKPTGGYTIDLFKDKSQYFIHPKFVFPKSINNTLGQIQTISGDTSGSTTIVTLLEYPIESYEYLEASLPDHTITGATPFSGLTIRGAFFTYFIPPKRPNLEVGGGDGSNPVVGRQSTFSPTYNFNNVDDGDYYRLQVTYNITDYTFTDNTKVDFSINKQDGDAEFVRTYSTPLTPNKEFLYRIGNTKEIINLFGVKQSITTWSNYVQAETANDGRFSLSGVCYRNYVYATTYTADTFGNLTLISGGTELSGVTLELIGISSNSSVDLSVDSKVDSRIFTPVNSVLGTNTTSQGITYTTTSGPNGAFDFGRVEGGTYTLRIPPPVEYTNAYSIQTQTISITDDTDLEIVLGIIWGNNIIDFSFPTTFL